MTNNKESAARLARVQENCHIVLHADATNVDIVKSTLALTLLREKLARLAAQDPSLDPETLRSSDCFDLIASLLQEANVSFPRLLRSLTKNGWESRRSTPVREIAIATPPSEPGEGMVEAEVLDDVDELALAPDDITLQIANAASTDIDVETCQKAME